MPVVDPKDQTIVPLKIVREYVLKPKMLNRMKQTIRDIESGKEKGIPYKQVFDKLLNRSS